VQKSVLVRCALAHPNLSCYVCSEQPEVCAVCVFVHVRIISKWYQILFQIMQHLVLFLKQETLLTLLQSTQLHGIHLGSYGMPFVSKLVNITVFNYQLQIYKHCD